MLDPKIKEECLRALAKDGLWKLTGKNFYHGKPFEHDPAHPHRRFQSDFYNVPRDTRAKIWMMKCKGYKPPKIMKELGLSYNEVHSTIRLVQKNGTID